MGMFLGSAIFRGSLVEFQNGKKKKGKKEKRRKKLKNEMKGRFIFLFYFSLVVVLQ